jgi:hypothetical protein
MRRVAMMLAVAVLATAIAPASAHADGDPASDVLLGDNVFYPYSPTVSPKLQQLLGLVTAAAANRARLPVKVALIHSPPDLGAITSLYGKPQQYAAFLDQEISFVNSKLLLLVVMPNGYGVAGFGPAGQRAVASLKKPSSGQVDDLARAAVVAVTRLAAADGHPIPTVSAPSGTSSTPTAAIAALLAAAAIAIAATVLAIRQRRARAR